MDGMTLRSPLSLAAGGVAGLAIRPGVEDNRAGVGKTIGGAVGTGAAGLMGMWDRFPAGSAGPTFPSPPHDYQPLIQATKAISDFQPDSKKPS